MAMARYTIAALLLILSSATFACDEKCKKAEAEEKFATKFPGFLNWKYCDRLKYDFMTVDIESLISYGSKHFQTKFKGPIRNIITMIEQREAWLSECDDYLTKTRDERIFYDTKTTDDVFGKMGKIKDELNAVLSGVTYSSAQGDETQKIVHEKFEALYDAVDTHKNLMHLKGKLVYQ
jgi:hypothetical protein